MLFPLSLQYSDHQAKGESWSSVNLPITSLLHAPSSHPVPKVRFASHFPNLLQCSPHLNHAIPDHPGIQTQSSFYCMLCFRRAVESQEEVVSLVIGGALFARRLWEEESTPVGESAYHAAGG